MNRHRQLACAALVAAVFATPVTARDPFPTETLTLDYGKIRNSWPAAEPPADLAAKTRPIGLLVPAVQNARQSAADAPRVPTPIEALAADAERSHAIRQGDWILDAGRPPATAPSNPAKEIAGARLAAPRGPESRPSLTSVGSGSAARGAHPDFAWLPSQKAGTPPPGRSEPPAASVATPHARPQPYTLIELLPPKGRH